MAQGFRALAPLRWAAARVVRRAALWERAGALGLIAALLLPPALGAVEVGATFPPLNASALEGELPDLGAARVVIVDFWASWCAPCKQSFPVYDQLHADYAGRGVVIVAVNVDRAARDMEKFLARHPVSFPVVRDAAQQLVAAVSPPTMPTAYVLDRAGTVRFIHRGFHGEKSRLEYVAQIDALLSEQP